jgi:hypothetical protein
MRPFHAAQPCACAVLAALLLAGCATEQPTEPPGGPPSVPGDLQAHAIAVRVDVTAGTVTPLDRTAPATASGVSFALVGANEVAATTTNFFRSAVGQFIAKKVRVRFDVALTNRTTVALITPTFPTPPAGTHSVMLFPFSTTLAAGNGAIDASTDWNGEGSPGSGAAINFFNDASCSSGGKSDCYRWEGFPSPFAAGTTTAAQTVGFDVDPTVQTFVVYFVLAADLPIPGSIAGTVHVPGRRLLPGVTITLNPVSRVTTSAPVTAAYGFSAVLPGAYTLSVGGLPADCLVPVPAPVTVVSGTVATVNLSVHCQLIAFSSEGNGALATEIWTMNKDGSNQTQLTHAGGFNASFEAAWSPDGERIAFERADLSLNEDEDPDEELYVMNADGTGETRITNNAAGDRSPAWTHDGTRIAFVSDRDGTSDIYLMDPDGSNATRLTNSSQVEFELVYSPDGSKLAFAAVTSNFTNDANVYVMNADGTGLTQLTNTFTDAHPTWSPDGTKIAFYSGRDGIGRQEIYVMDANGQNQARITNDASTFAAYPTWSPDGTTIVFSRLSSANPISVDLYRVNPDGSNIVRLTTIPGTDNFPSFQR